MKNMVIKQLKTELRSYREYLVTGEFTALQLYGEAYQIVIKQEIVDAVERIGKENLLSDEVWNWLGGKDNVLEYIYQLLIYSEHSFADDFMDLLRKEVEHDREVHINE